MTTTTKSQALVASSLARGRLVLAKGSFTLKDLATAVIDPVDDTSADLVEIDFPAVPNRLVLTPEAEAALAKVPEVFAKVQPETRRSLSDAEIKSLREEQEVLRTIIGDLAKRDEVIKEYIRTHQDVQAEETNTAVRKPQKAANGTVIVHATPRDAKGHYLLAKPGQPVVTPIPDTNEAYKNEYREGTVQVRGDLLTSMEAAGEIDRADYLAMTREVRVFDEDKARQAIVAKPERMTILRQITTRSAPGTALNIRKIG